MWSTARRILVVDDNEDAAEMLGEALRELGHEVVVAHDGPEALKTLQRFTPAIAFLDVGLPIMNGYELAARIRETAGMSTIWLIAVTGYGEARDRDEAHAAGFDRHVVKPIDLSRLADLVQAAPVRS